MKKGDCKNTKPVSEQKMDRKKAIKKMGITALTATSLVFLETKTASADSKNSAQKAPRRGR